MTRHGCRSISAPGPAALAALLVALGVPPSPAAAEPVDPTPTPVLTITGQPGQRIGVDTPPERYATPSAAQASQTIYLNRCDGGCTVHIGNNDGQTDTSTIPQPFTGNPGPGFVMSEFQNSALQTGAAADAEWAMVVQCMKEVY